MTNQSAKSTTLIMTSPTVTIKPDLDVILAEWQPVMRLADWEVKIAYERHQKEPGNVSYSVRQRRATISIMDPVDAEPLRPWDLDIERTVIVELALLHFAPFDYNTGDPRDLFESQAVHSLAHALVSLKRRPSTLGYIKQQEQPDLNELLAFWRVVLRVTDWDIVVCYKRHMENAGTCSAEEDYKRARIRILDPIDYQDPDRPFDVEKTFVHEMVHLHLAMLKIRDRNHAHWMFEEQAVESFARALVEVRRKFAR